MRSSLSALESSIKTLDDQSTFWEGLLPWFTAMVVIGVAAEIGVIFWDHCEELAAWRRGIIRPPDHPSVRKLMLNVIATALVVFGVFGEFAIGIAIAYINGQLRTKNADFRDKSGQLIALVTQDAARLHKDAEKEHLERMQLETIVTPRRLTVELQQAIAASLNRFKGKSVVISSYALDTESEVLGEEICAALNDAKIHCTLNLGSIRIFGRPLKGIRVAGPKSNKFVSDLESSLRDDGHLDIAGPHEQIIPPIIGSTFEELGIRTNRKVDASIFVGVKPSLIKLPMPSQ